jgi:hypothetical protein
MTLDGVHGGRMFCIPSSPFSGTRYNYFHVRIAWHVRQVAGGRQFSLMKIAEHGGHTGPHKDGWGIVYSVKSILAFYPEF